MSGLQRDSTGYYILEELAQNLRWTWCHTADRVWESLDPHLWKVTGNPWVVFHTISKKKIEEKLLDPEFRSLLDELLLTIREEEGSSGWFHEAYPNSPLTSAAYFSMEFMLTEGLPIYSGGLGNVAGDQLKAASDLNIPVIGIGLLYQLGYFRQMIDKEGAQQELFPYNDPSQLPIHPLRGKNGEWLRFEIAFPGYTLWIRTWEVLVGRRRLYLLDANDSANAPLHRGITSELYGKGQEIRLQQEMILGIGGFRLLEALGISPEVCHLNEGHTALVVLERARSFMQSTGAHFKKALAATRSGNLLTTHTAVAAGFDRYPPSMIETYLGHYAKEMLGISLYELLALGRKDPDDEGEPFNMTYLAIRGSGRVNAVSKLHKEVSKELFYPIFPRWPKSEVPIGYVTNGVHMPSWESSYADALWTKACGKSRWLGTTENLEGKIRQISKEEIWDMRSKAHLDLIDFLRETLARQMRERGEAEEEIASAAYHFDPNWLILGFARRFTSYKRPNLLLRDPERLLKILSNPKYPVLLIIAGKAHPRDEEGKRLVKEWNCFIANPKARAHLLFLSDYDLNLTEHLVQGVDVWINTPRHPWEACGTSGMKILVNGGLNCSILDGWWVEGYSPKVGWAIGSPDKEPSESLQDAADAESLYRLLENSIIPEYYDRGQSDIPEAWVERIRESMSLLTPHYSANRAVREYTEHYYLPAAAAYRERCRSGAALAGEIVDWQHRIEKNFSSLKFGPLNVESIDGKHYFSLQIPLKELDAKEVTVELFREDGHLQTMERDQNGFYRASVPIDGIPLEHYTPRLRPSFHGAHLPLEQNSILWQK